MTLRLTALTAAALFAISTGVFAQTTETEATETATDQDAAPQAAPETATETAAGTAPAGDAAAEEVPGGLNLGLVDAVPQVGQTYVRNLEGDWEVQCIKSEDGENEPCQIYQLLFDEAGNAVAEMSLFRLPDGGQAVAGATVAVPLETALQAQLRIAVDKGNPKRYQFSHGDSAGCYARIGLTNEDVNAFKRGANATMVIVPVLAPDQEVSLNMSLKGFTASYEQSSIVVGQ
jgi:invasion protein IalB